VKLALNDQYKKVVFFSIPLFLLYDKYILLLIYDKKRIFIFVSNNVLLRCTFLTFVWE